MSDPWLVLVADDDEDVRTITRAILEDRGSRVVEAVNGEEAFALAASERPDLILLDLMMPGSDGWAAMARLRDEAATASIPIVALTSSEPPLEKIREAGFCAILNKPVTPPNLAEAVAICLEAHAGGERWIPDLARRIGG
jgi:CheY-like chemotaxis protein